MRWSKRFDVRLVYHMKTMTTRRRRRRASMDKG